jgi:hypothetical protein
MQLKWNFICFSISLHDNFCLINIQILSANRHHVCAASANLFPFDEAQEFKRIHQNPQRMLLIWRLSVHETLKGMMKVEREKQKKNYTQKSLLKLKKSV